MTVHTQQVGAAPLPAPRLGNLNKLSVEDVVGACLVSSDAPDSHSKLKRKLEELLTDAEIRVALIPIPFDPVRSRKMLPNQEEVFFGDPAQVGDLTS